MIKSTAAAAAMLALLLLSSAAEAAAIDADVTGNWYIPGQSGHGLQIEVLKNSEAVVAWYTFDADGNPQWLFGVGEIAGDSIEAELSRYAGAKFPPDFDPDSIQGEVWGTLVFRRTGCDAATLAYAPEDGIHQPAEFPLVRLTRIDGSGCRENWSQVVRWRPGHDADRSFEPLFLDYPDGSEDFYELTTDYGALPEPWQDMYGLKISGNNHSDDLMMVLMRPLDGLEPGMTYTLEFEMQFATDVPAGCAGVGGSPGESVYMRLGAAGEKPGFTVADDGHRRATLDLGQQANDGEDALSAGNMVNGADESLCGDPERPWRLKRVSTTGQEFTVTSDENGRIWVYGLSDSAFEATSTWYLTELVVRLR